MAHDSLIAGVRRGDVRTIARAISAIENELPSARPLRAWLGSFAPTGVVVGITGPPGVGKSTIVDALISAFRSRGGRVAVLAVDPSSPFSGGAILGDRVRMQHHAADDGVFIRSMATRGQLGGLARATADAARVLQAAGLDTVIIETVGVGQDEIDIARTADITIVVLAPGSGDDVQAMKAGLMEVADIFVLNKADLPGADRAAAAIQREIAHDEPTAPGWTPPVVRTIASTGEGISELADVVARFRAVVGRRPPRQWTGGDMPLRTEVCLDHVAIATDSLSQTLSFLAGVLRLPVTPIEDAEGQRVRVQFAGSGETRLELVEPAGPNSPISRFLQERGPGLHHVAFRVPDLEAKVRELRERGIRMIDDAPRLGSDGTRVAFVHPSSTHGVLIELVGRETA